MLVESSLAQESNSTECQSGASARRKRVAIKSGWVADSLAIAWIVVAGLAVLAPALAHGPFLGAFDWLSKYGLSTKPGVILHNRTNGDQIDTMMPWMDLAWKQVHQGQLPLWNPYNGFGLPLAFNWQSAPFSLSTIVGYLVPLRYAYDLSIVATVVIAGSGAYVLGRVLGLGRLAAAGAATMFELSGPFVGWLGWPHASVMSWSGWVFAAAVLVARGGDRRAWRVVFLAVSFAFALYAGQPEIAIMLALSLALFLVVLLAVRVRSEGIRSVTRPVVDLGAGIAAGLGLAAPLLLPAAQVTSHSVRNSIGRGGALPPHDLMQVISQGFDGLPFAGSKVFNDPLFYSEAAGYVGVIALVLAVVAIGGRKRPRPEVIAFGVVALAMAAIVFVPPAVSLMTSLPGGGKVLWQRALLPMAFAISIMAGFGLDALVHHPRDRRLLQWMAAAFGSAALVLVLVFAFGRGHLPASEASDRARSFIWPFVAAATGLVVTGALFGFARASRSSSGPPSDPSPSARRLGVTSAVILLACETLFLVASGAPWFSSSSQSLVPNASERQLLAVVGSSIVGAGSGVCGDLGVLPDVNVAYGLHELDAYDPVVPNAYFQLMTNLTGQGGGLPEFLNEFCPQITSERVARRFGVSYVLEAKGEAGPPGSRFVRQIGNEDLYYIPDSGQATLTPTTRSGELPPPDALGRPVALTRPEAAVLQVRTASSTPQILRFRLTDLPGWRATIDGRPLTLQGYSGVMLQARIPPGQHLVVLRYWPQTFTLGLGLAGITLLVLVAAVVTEGFVGRRRSRMS